jgi:hypothetical protein
MTEKDALATAAFAQQHQCFALKNIQRKSPENLLLPYFLHEIAH